MKDALKEGAAKTVGVVTAGATPAVTVAVGGSATHLAGGAAVMKTLAVAGSLAGGGAITGVAIVGAASLGAGYLTYLGIKRLLK